MEGRRQALPEAEEKKVLRRYAKAELELMSTYQLREICRKERIIRGILNPLDKDELIHTIMKSHGAREEQLIKRENAGGKKRLQALLQSVQLREENVPAFQAASKITVYKGRSLGYQDQITIPYQPELEGTNALLIGEGKKICGIFYLSPYGGRQKYLYLLKGKTIVCQESVHKKYELLFFKRKESDLLYQQYLEGSNTMPAALRVIRVPLLNFEVKNPIKLQLPMAVDFGSTNTTAGVYLDAAYMEQAGRSAFLQGKSANTIQYTTFYEEEGGEIRERHLLPSIIGIRAVGENGPEFVYGYEASRMAGLSYIDEGFCVFYDIKRWVSDYEKEEEVIDRQGRRALIKRKEILKSFFRYLIRETEDCFKCKIGQIHISCPVKQKYLFHKLFQEILPQRVMPPEEMIDEGVSVLYHTISAMLEGKKLKEDYPYQALIVDCGGGTTDLSACRFRIRDKRVSYRIDMETAYENGDTDFGGNNLTYRIMQYLKLCLVKELKLAGALRPEAVIEDLDRDIFRYVDRHGVKKLYEKLEEAYRQAESYLPTRYQEYEVRGMTEYCRVKNNFYTLFLLAEQIKKRFYERTGVMQVSVSSEAEPGTAGEWIQADKWKLSVWKGNELQIIKEFPKLTFYLYTIDLLLKGDIYGIIRKFMEPLYLEDRVNEYSFLKLTGQSCKIEIFRDALKEFMPGRMIQFKKREQEQQGEAELKMSCIDGALKYLRDKKLGYAEVVIVSSKPVLPYTITALTHSGEEVVLIDGFDRREDTKSISRNLDQVTLQLFLKDADQTIRYRFYYDCRPQKFKQVTYEETAAQYGSHILQKETDTIANGEIKFFAWKRFEEWGYVIVPIYRQEDKLYLGAEQSYAFENEGWMHHYFDGLK